MAVLVLLSACANRLETAQTLAASSHLQQVEIQTHKFKLTAFVRQTDANAPTDIYIEGDGFAWVTVSQPSVDPTPKQAVGLLLASLDPSPNVVYLARPCQFTKGDPACHVDYWTSKRFSEEVVASMDEAIDRTVGRKTKQGLHLVGYSGGGAIAALMAARRNDILSLRTVAGNLDPTTFSQHHHVSPLKGSLDPMQIADRLSHTPQRHFVGGQDDVVPSVLVENFVQAQMPTDCVQIIRAPKATHNHGWDEVWLNEMKTVQPVCR